VIARALISLRLSQDLRIVIEACEANEGEFAKRLARLEETAKIAEGG